VEAAGVYLIAGPDFILNIVMPMLQLELEGGRGGKQIPQTASALASKVGCKSMST
jgi:hypothetical protein